jgi:DNA/RNA endonuclease YhcR with UshA esterase domain
MLLASVFLLLAAVPAFAQTEPADVTVRQINALTPENLNALKQGAETLTNAQVESLIRSQYTGQVVRFKAVVLSDPRKSGLATPNATTGLPTRIHVFVRDVAAETEGVEGMNTQIVDGTWQQTGSGNLFVGDVIEVVGTVTYFGNTQQINVESLTLIGDIESEGLSPSILDPVLTTTNEIMVSLGDLSTQPDWDRFSDFVNQYIRIEDALVWRSPNRRDVRPNYILTSDNAQTFLHSDDISLRYRNDMSGYDSSFDPRPSDDPFVAPPAGAIVNIQGFVLLRGTFAAEPIGTPAAALFRINPWTDEDIEITATPLILDIEPVPFAAIPGDEQVEVVVDYEGNASDITEATLYYTTTGGSASKASVNDETALPMTVEEGRLRASIPAQEDGAFVTYRVEIKDVEGRTYNSTPITYRVLHDGITRIRHLSERHTGLRGPSPFVNQTLDMDITAIVTNNPTRSGFVALQDEAGGLFSGAILQNSSAVQGLGLQEGDRVRITSGTVRSIRGDMVFTAAGDVPAIATPTIQKLDAGDPVEPVLVTTGVLQDQAVAAAHMGMLLRFEDVTITNNNLGFGEWSFATEGEAALVADDASTEIGATFASTTFEEDDRLTFIQGILTYGFGTWRIIPRDLSDIGPFVDTSNEVELAVGFELSQNYPNPFNPTTRIEFSVPMGGHATLEVFDMLGRRVATLVDNVVTSGQHHAIFDANHLSSGLYVYRLSAGERTVSRTMMLVK